MNHIIICSHGSLANSLVESLTMVFGHVNDISTVCLTEQGGIALFQQQFAENLARITPQADGIFIFCDLENGTPYNVACRYAFDQNYPKPIVAIAGVNFPMLLIAMDYLENDGLNYQIDAIKKQAQQIITQAQNSIKIASLLRSPTQTDQDDDF